MRNRKNSVNFLLLALPFLPLAAGVDDESFAQQEFSLSQEAYNYLQEAIQPMEIGSINQKMIDWDVFKREVYQKASNALTPRDTYEAIKFAISLLGDQHSFFLRPEQIDFLETQENREMVDRIRSTLIDDHIGYLQVPSCHCLSEQTLKSYALSLQNEIAALDQYALDKWIVDLRGNSGGHMWPMVLGLRPLIHAEIFGFFSDGSGEFSAWRFDDLSVKNQDFELCSLDSSSYELKHPTPKIAILVDQETASSGEMTAIAFLGQDQTKVFGQKTGGYTSANELIRLSDGAAILLATTYSADRLGRIYRDGITPDKIIEEKTTTLQKAVEWLEEEK